MSMQGSIERGIAQGRKQVLVTMLNTAKILRQTDTRDATGSPKKGVWAQVAEVRCGLAVATANATAEQIDAMRITSNKDYLFRFPYGTAITQKDRIQIDDRLWEVLSVGATHALSIQVVVFARTI